MFKTNAVGKVKHMFMCITLFLKPRGMEMKKRDFMFSRHIIPNC
jgi:hypothetical protein